MKIPKWFPPLGSKTLDPIAANANLRVIGDTGSGKTAYMASLAYLTKCSNRNLDSPIESVTAFGDQDASQELLKYAQDILEQGLELEATKLNKNSAGEVADYGLNIALKSHFSWKSSQFGFRPIQLIITCKDYSGEFFQDLIHKIGDPYLDDYLDDCKLSTGILLLIDGTAYRNDSLYAQGLENFFIALDQAGESSKDRRIAFVLSKCELSQLWVNRKQPKELTNRLFPLTMRKLEDWKEKDLRAVDYFAISAFGTLGTDFPEPNTTLLQRSRNGSSCVIRKPKLWRPFGLVSPIYWLCTGQRHKTLDED